MSQRKKPKQSPTSGSVADNVMRASVLPAFLLLAAVIAILIPSRDNHAAGLNYAAVWVGLSGLVAAFAVLAGNTLPRLRKALLAAAGAFLAWTLLSSLVSGRVWAALVGEFTNRIGWMTLVALTAFAIASQMHGATLRDLLRRFAWFVVIVEIVITTAQLASGEFLASMAGGTLSNPTYLGEALLLLLPWTLPRRDDGSSVQAARYITILAAIVILTATQSRMALVVAVVWLGWIVARRWRAPKRDKAVLLAGVLATIGAVIAFFVPRTFFSADGPLAFGGRFAMWEHSLAALVKRPILGWGADGYWPGAATIRTVERAVASHSLPVGAGATDPHNLIAWVAVSSGIVGLGLFAWLCVEVIRSWRGATGDGVDHGAERWALLGCVVVGLTAPMALPVLPLFALVLGVSLAAPPANKAKAGKPAPAAKGAKESVEATAGPAWRVGAAAMALVCLVFALNAGFRAAYEEGGRDVSPRLAPGAAKAAALWSFDAHMQYLSALHSGWAGFLDPASGYMDRALPSMRRAVELDRNPFYALEMARMVRQIDGTASTVDAAFAEAFERYPAFPVARAEYAAYLADTGRVGEAREQMELVSAIDDDDPERAAAFEAARAAIEQAGSDSSVQ